MEPPSWPRVAIHNSSGQSPLPRKRLAEAVSLTQPEGEVNVLLTTDEEMRRLNREFRGRDQATDVLTFPAPPFPGGPLGEIAISVPMARLQAEARGVSLTNELIHLALHGALHLQGLDDETDAGREAMQKEMARLARQLGLSTEDHWVSRHPEEVPA